MNAQPQSRPARQPERWFFAAMALLALVIAAVGFAPSFYLVPLSGKPELLLSLTPLVIFHGCLFTSWIVLQLIQPLLITAGRTRTHRRLGIAGGWLAGSMVVVGWLTAIYGAARGSGPPGIDPKRFMAVPWFDVVVFAILVGAGLVSRKHPQAHKRWMVLATLSILPAAVARWPIPFVQSGPLGFFGASDLLIVPLIVWDLSSTGRVHRATWIGTLVIIAFQVIRLQISQTAAWLSFAETMIEAVAR